MGSYTVVAPCIVTVDGKSQHHTRTGRVVEVDDAEAAPLVDAGQLAPRERPAPPVDDPEPAEVAPEPPAEPPRRGGRTR